MAGWRPCAGATLLMPSGVEGNHLFVILNDPKVFPGYGPNPCVALVNLSTVRAEVSYDNTCVLQAGCHSFVVRNSYVVYRNVRIEQETHLITLVLQGLFRPHDPILGTDFTNIKNGLTGSPFTKREFKQLEI